MSRVPILLMVWYKECLWRHVQEISWCQFCFQQRLRQLGGDQFVMVNLFVSKKLCVACQVTLKRCSLRFCLPDDAIQLPLLTTASGNIRSQFHQLCPLRKRASSQQSRGSQTMPTRTTAKPCVIRCGCWLELQLQEFECIRCATVCQCRPTSCRPSLQTMVPRACLMHRNSLHPESTELSTFMSSSAAKSERRPSGSRS